MRPEWSSHPDSSTSNPTHGTHCSGVTDESSGKSHRASLPKYLANPQRLRRSTRTWTRSKTFPIQPKQFSLFTKPSTANTASARGSTRWALTATPSTPAHTSAHPPCAHTPKDKPQVRQQLQSSTPCVHLSGTRSHMVHS